VTANANETNTPRPPNPFRWSAKFIDAGCHIVPRRYKY
jgi:hypothetical protein